MKHSSRTNGRRVSGVGCRGKRPTRRLRVHLNPEPRTPKHNGFSLVELIIGLLLLAIIGSATAAVATSVARGWQMGEGSGGTTLTIGRTMLRVQDKIQRSKFIGQYRSGSVVTPGTVAGAAVLFWREDANGDGLMQLDETQLLEYSPSKQALLVWETEFPTPGVRAAMNGPYPTTFLTGLTAIDDYKNLAYTKKHVITRNVLGASFNVITPTSVSQRLAFEFQLKFNGANGPTVEYGTAVPRSPAT